MASCARQTKTLNSTIGPPRRVENTSRSSTRKNDWHDNTDATRDRSTRIHKAQQREGFTSELIERANDQPTIREGHTMLKMSQRLDKRLESDTTSLFKKLISASASEDWLTILRTSSRSARRAAINVVSSCCLSESIKLLR